MKARIYHNPKCGTSRNTLEILQKHPGVDVEIIEYLRNPPTAEMLAALYVKAGIAPRDGVRKQNTDAEERGLTTADDATVLAAMMADPVLIQRPIVETEKGVRLCRPPEKVLEIL